MARASNEINDDDESASKETDGAPSPTAKKSSLRIQIPKISDVIPPSPLKRKRNDPTVPPKRPRRLLPLNQNRSLLTSPPPIHSVPTLPDGRFFVWKFFLENGGYFSVNTPSGKPAKVSVMSVNKQQQCIRFVSAVLYPQGENFWRRGWKSSQIRFHNLVKQMREDCAFSAPRDGWETCLPPKSTDWYEFAALVLMLCSALIPDQRLLPVMQSLFSKYDVTPAFVLEKHAADPLFWETLLRDLGRQVSNANNVILAAATTLRLKRVPRNYTKLVLNYKGVGPKMALVTVHSSYNDVVSLYFFCYFIINSNKHLFLIHAAARSTDRQSSFENLPLQWLDPKRGRQRLSLPLPSQHRRLVPQGQMGGTQQGLVRAWTNFQAEKNWRRLSQTSLFEL
jgi:hypothetical protein